MADIEKRVIAPAARAAVILFIVLVSGMWGSPALNWRYAGPVAEP